MTEAAALTPSSLLGVGPGVRPVALRTAGSVREHCAGGGAAGSDPAATVRSVDCVLAV